MSPEKTVLTDDISGYFLSIFSPYIKEEKYNAGELICEEGSFADKFFVISDGEVEIRKVIDRDEGRFKPVSILVKGDFFGEMAVFLELPRSADAVAKTAVTLLAVSRKDFSTLFADKPDEAYRAMEYFAAVLMNRLRSTTKELATVYETGRLVASAHNINELSDFVMENVMKAVETADAGVFVIWNEYNGEFDVRLQHGLDFEADYSMQSDDPLVKWLNENKETFLSFDLENAQGIKVPEGSIYKCSSMIAAPFFIRERLLGFMLLLNRTSKNAFSYNQMILLSAISGYVSVALENLQYIQDEIDRSRLRQGKTSIPF